VNKIKVVISVDRSIQLKCLRKIRQKRRRSAQGHLPALRPGDPQPQQTLAHCLNGCSSTQNVTIWAVLPLQINQKLGLKDKEESRILAKEDWSPRQVFAPLKQGEGSLTTLTISAARASDGRRITLQPVPRRACAHVNVSLRKHELLRSDRRANDAAEAHQSESAVGGYRISSAVRN